MRVALALVHHPVLDRDGNVVTTAITNLDLHDMARCAKTYGAERLFVVHPVAAQRLLAERIRDHWVEGSGKKRIPDRAVALGVLQVVESLEQACVEFANQHRVPGPDLLPTSSLQSPASGLQWSGVEVWTTAASTRGLSVTTIPDARLRLQQTTRPVMIAFGTGWGLAEAVVANADVRLEPIRALADTGYNHLSVRSACAITLDRLLG